MAYTPKRVFFENEALNYDLGKKLQDKFESLGIPINILNSHNKVTGIPGKTPQEAYAEGKNTMVIGVRHTLNFESCKPSAHFQLPLVTSCAGKCEYCYLNTQLGKKPYIRVYVNTDEILAQAQKYINERKPDITLFEGAATSDPIVVEPYTGSLYKVINFFGTQSHAKFRFVTKFTEVDSLLNANHNGNTTIRFSINAENIIKSYEHGTPSLNDRIDASFKIIDAGYQLGFIIAPVFLYTGWENDYKSMLDSLGKRFEKYKDKEIDFEVISHRYTERAKNNILQVFPNSKLPMDKENRKFKFGQFGYGKYVYTEELLSEMKSFFQTNLLKIFPNCTIKYII